MADERGLTELIAAEPDGRLRRNLIQTLVVRGTPTAVSRYLNLLGSPALHLEALAAVAEMDDPPIDALAKFLDDPRPPLRLAAAQALATRTEALAVKRLSQSVGGIGRQEALMALLASPSRQAASLVNEARGNLYLMASLCAAEQKLETWKTQSGGNLP